MRGAYILIGIGFIVLAAGTYLGTSVFNRGFTPSGDTVGNATTSTMTPRSTLKLKSSAFADGGLIPSRFTCDGAQLSPPLAISGVPKAAKSLVLFVEDPDAPKAVVPSGLFVHWVLFNIPATTTAIAEGTAPGVQGLNGSGNAAYTGPCPPPQYEPSEHRYFFYLYALDAKLDLQGGATKDSVTKAMQRHMLDTATLMGRYKRE